MSDTGDKNDTPPLTANAVTRPEPESPSKNQSEIIPPGLDSALRASGIDPKDPTVTRALEISLMMFSGSLPLAPPPILKEYQSIKPEIVDKLIEWTETQAAHRRDLERTRTERSENRFDRGQKIAAAVALGGLILAAAEGVFGNPWVAAVIAIVAIGGPTAAIIMARNMRAQQTPKPPTPPAPLTHPPAQ